MYWINISAGYMEHTYCIREGFGGCHGILLDMLQPMALTGAHSLDEKLTDGLTQEWGMVPHPAGARHQGCPPRA